MSGEIVEDIKMPRPLYWDKLAEQAEVMYPEIFISKDAIELNSLIEQVRHITRMTMIVDPVKIFLCALTAFELLQYIEKVKQRNALIKELADALENMDFRSFDTQEHSSLIAKSREVVNDESMD